eukprot:m.351115 g.351115  ORF g.351115 m.351115 type:complete len:109 (+) comp16171_c0_seq1:559-885(+)
MSTPELACAYAALILADDGVEVTGDKIATLLKTAKVSVEPFWPGLFANALAGKDIVDMLGNVGSGSGAAAPAAAAAGGDGGSAAAEEKAPEPESESEDDDMDGFSLFD